MIQTQTHTDTGTGRRWLLDRRSPSVHPSSTSGPLQWGKLQTLVQMGCSRLTCKILGALPVLSKTNTQCGWPPFNWLFGLVLMQKFWAYYKEFYVSDVFVVWLSYMLPVFFNMWSASNGLPQIHWQNVHTISHHWQEKAYCEIVSMARYCLVNLPRSTYDGNTMTLVMLHLSRKMT